MPEKQPYLLGALITLITSLYIFLGKRVFDLPKNYVGKADYEKGIEELKVANLRLEAKVEKGLVRIYDKLDEKRDKQRCDDKEE